MKKVIEFLQNEHIQVALATGSAIIILALVFKRVFHVPIKGIESALPSLVFVAWEVVRAKRKDRPGIWTRPWPWIVLMYVVVALIVARRYLIAGS